MSDLYKIAFVIFMSLSFVFAFIVNISRFDLKVASVNYQNKNLTRFVDLLDVGITRMLDMNGKVVIDSTGFYFSTNKFSKRKRLNLGKGDSFYYFAQDVSVKFTIDEIEEKGVIISYDTRWVDKSTGQEVVNADTGVFAMPWRF